MEKAIFALCLLICIILTVLLVMYLYDRGSEIDEPIPDEKSFLYKGNDGYSKDVQHFDELHYMQSGAKHLPWIFCRFLNY